MIERRPPAWRMAVMIDRLVLGGVEKTAIEEVHGLREIGIDATLLVLKRDEVVPEAFRTRLSGIPVEYLDQRLPRLLRLSWRMPGFTFFSLFHLVYALTLPMRVAPREWDVILSHNHYTTFTAWTLWKVRRISYCMYIWDPTTSILTRAYPTGIVRMMRPLLMPLGKLIDRMLARGGREVMVPSHSYVKYLRGLLPPDARVTVAPPGCFPAATPRQKVGDHLLAATSWKKGKQLEVLLHALATIPKARLVVAGRWLHADYRARMEDLVSQLHLHDRVRFEGEYDEAGMAGLVGDALCVVTMNAELGFGMPALEAAAQSCTFVCPRVAGVAAHFEEGREAFYFDEGDSAGLARALRALVDQPEVAYRAGLAAWERARSSLTWRHHALALAAVVGGLSGDQRSAGAQPTV